MNYELNINSERQSSLLMSTAIQQNMYAILFLMPFARILTLYLTFLMAATIHYSMIPLSWLP